MIITIIAVVVFALLAFVVALLGFAFVRERLETATTRLAPDLKPRAMLSELFSFQVVWCETPAGLDGPCTTIDEQTMCVCGDNESTIRETALEALQMVVLLTMFENPRMFRTTPAADKSFVASAQRPGAMQLARLLVFAWRTPVAGAAQWYDTCHVDVLRDSATTGRVFCGSALAVRRR